MGDSLKYYLFYCAIIKQLYPNVDWGLIGSQEHENIFFEFKICDLVNVQSMMEKVRSFRFADGFQFQIETKKIRIKEYLKILKKENQLYKYELLIKYLVYDKYAKWDKSELNYLFSFFYETRDFDIEKDYYLKETLDDAKYAFRKIEHTLTLPVTEWGKELEILLTFLFISLHSLIINIKKIEAYKIEYGKIIRTIKINKYGRYRNNKPMQVRNIEETIRHFRDVVCHKKESSSSKIVCTVENDNIIQMTSNVKNDPKFIYGGGSIKLSQIKELIKGFAILLSEHIEIISIKSTIEGNILFHDFLSKLHPFLNVPVKNFFTIKYNPENKFYRFTIAANYF
jgi:hypothetical protein